MNFEDVIELIGKYQTITLYRHVHPDCDAQGAQFGMKTWLELNFPEKNIYALGNDFCSQRTFPTLDVVDEEIIRHSLAIVLDTANQARVDDQRYVLAEKVIKIDHHPNFEPFGDLVKVYEESAATCEILAEFFQQMSTRYQYQINKECAEYLYSGLLTDTLCFRTSNTSPHTLKVASFLSEFNINIAELNRCLFDQSVSSFQFANYLRNEVQITESGYLAYKVISLAEQEKWNISPSSARNFIDEFGHVKEFEIWAIFTEKISDDNKTILLDGSLRSKKVQMNDIAAKFNGGGHKNACGVKNLTYDDMNCLLLELEKRNKKI